MSDGRVPVLDKLWRKLHCSLREFAKANAGFDEIEVVLDLLNSKSVQTALLSAGLPGSTKESPRYICSITQRPDQISIESNQISWSNNAIACLSPPWICAAARREQVTFDPFSAELDVRLMQDRPDLPFCHPGP